MLKFTTEKQLENSIYIHTLDIMYQDQLLLCYYYYRN